MQFMMLIYGDPDTAPAPDSPEGQAEFAGWVTYTQAMRDAGIHVAGDPLQPAQTATTVRVRDGETLTVDGPFAETKEILGGYYIVDVADLDDALGWAAKAPNISHASVEVRPVMAFG